MNQTTNESIDQFRSNIDNLSSNQSQPRNQPNNESINQLCQWPNIQIQATDAKWMKGVTAVLDLVPVVPTWKDLFPHEQSWERLEVGTGNQSRRECRGEKQGLSCSA